MKNNQAWELLKTWKTLHKQLRRLGYSTKVITAIKHIYLYGKLEG